MLGFMAILRSNEPPFEWPQKSKRNKHCKRQKNRTEKPQRGLVIRINDKRRTDNNRVVNFPGDAAVIGQFIDLTITAVSAHTLRGEIATARV